MQLEEYDEFAKEFTGINATKLKLTYEFMVENGSVPFSSFGSKIDPFILNNEQAWAIQDVLNKYGVVTSFTLQYGRLSLVDASIQINLTGDLKQQSDAG